MTQTLTTETIKLWRINAEITLGETDELDPENNAAKAILDLTAELLRYREAAENPSCWEIAGQLFTTKEEALKPGYRGTPEPLYDGPVLTDDREAQPVAYLKKSIIDSDRFDSADPEIILHPNTPEGWHSEYQAVFTAPPAPVDSGVNAQSELVAIVERLNFCGYEVNGEGIDFTTASEAVGIVLQQLHEAVEAQAAPPAPAVPDFKALAKDLVENLVDCGGADEKAVEQYLAFAEKTCRAVMLAQPVRRGCTVVPVKHQNCPFCGRRQPEGGN